MKCLWKTHDRRKKFPPSGNFYIDTSLQLMRVFLHLFRRAHVNEVTNFGILAAGEKQQRDPRIFSIDAVGSGDF
jgi:hypothetical protein